MNIDEILEHVRPIVLKQIEEDMAPIFRALRQRALEVHEEISQDLMDKTKDLEDRTEFLVQAVFSLSASQLSSYHSSPQSQ